MTTYGDLRSWDAATLRAASMDLRRDLKALERARDDLEVASPDSWTGLSRMTAVLRQRLLVAQMTAHLGAAVGFEKALFAAEAPVREIRIEVDDLDADARRDEFSISDDGTVSDVAKPPEFGSLRQADAYWVERVQLGQALADRVAAVLAQALEVDGALLRALPRDGFVPEGETNYTDPEVAGEWDSMTDEERMRVIEHLARRLAEEWGVDEDFEIRIIDIVDEPGTNTFGSWSEGDRVLTIDIDDVGDPRILGTVAHEVRHIVQHQAAEDLPGGIEQWLIDQGIRDDDFEPPPGATRSEVESWRDRWENPEDYPDYRSRPTEVDAREAGDDFLHGFTADDLEDLREEAR